MGFVRKWNQLNECEVKNPTSAIETFEYRGKIYDKKKYISIRCQALLKHDLRDIEDIKKNAIKIPYADKGPEFYAVELEAMDKAIAIKLEEKIMKQEQRRSFLEFLGFKEEKKK